MKEEFRVGDIVKRVHGSYNNMKIGNTAKIIGISHRGIELEGYNSGDGGFHSKANLILIKHKALKDLKTPTHIVIWEEDRDPVKFFTSLKDANDFIKTLIEKSSVKKDSIILVEIKTAKRVEIVKNLRHKQYKI